MTNVECVEGRWLNPWTPCDRVADASASIGGCRDLWNVSNNRSPSCQFRCDSDVSRKYSISLDLSSCEKSHVPRAVNQ
jgi:hypothetical protein